ncbi:hypothetical protein DY000_02014565 [Brassica cretica]|uniref:Uncharacterized protein n=1 Tax=Brassica cretica TaxID=69181 RepID=A0ABQ7D4D8_BRACR|nr:hypothetical protein DY000_02014565 [Brassica cretica]
MPSSHSDKRSSDIEMGEATSAAPILTSPVEEPACVADHLSFRERLVRRQAEKELVRAGAEFPSSSALAIAPGHGTEVVTLQDAGTLAGSGVPDASALPAASSTTPFLVEDKERAADSMPPPPARKEIVLALRTPSAVSVAQPKGRKRKFTKGGDEESLQQGGSNISSGLRGKFMSLIDGMISECGSETSRLAGELSDFQVDGELDRDLGKTASSLLKEKNARKAKSSEARLAKISAFLGSLECIRSRDLALATIEGGIAVVQSFQKDPEGKDPEVGENRGDAAPGLDEATGEEVALHEIFEDVEYKHRGMFLGSRIFWISCLEMSETSMLGLGQDLGSGVPDASALPAGSSTTPILVEDKERAPDSMPPPPTRKEIVRALRAPSVVPVAQPKGRKRKFTKGGDGESSQQGGSSIVSGLRGKFMSLIDGMISECGSETSHLAGELLELQGRWSETEAMLTAVKDSNSVKVSKLEVAIGELERDLGKTASSLLKEKKARKAKSSESFQSETPPTLEAEGARLSGCKGDLAVVDGDLDLILADLKSACFLPTCSEGPKGKGPVLGETGGDLAPGLDEATGEEGA